MFLRVIGNSHRRQRLAINVIFFFVVIALLVVGLFTIKKNTYRNYDKWELAEEISRNATEKAQEGNTTSLNYTIILWDADLELVFAEKSELDNPKKDILLVVNTFIGVDDDVHDKRTWYVVVFSFVGSLLYGWNALRFALWIDRKLEGFLDDMAIYDNLGDENEFTDFVLDLRNQRMQGRPVEIKSTVSTQYDIKAYWSQLAKRMMKPFLPITPALFYLSLYATAVFLLTCYHTWMRKPNEISENMRAVSNYAAGLEASILSGKRDVNSYVFVIWGIICQLLFVLACYRCSELVIRIYCALIGKEDDVKPAFLDAIKDEEQKKKE